MVTQHKPGVVFRFRRPSSIPERQRIAPVGNCHIHSIGYHLRQSRAYREKGDPIEQVCEAIWLWISWRHRI